MDSLEGGGLPWKGYVGGSQGNVNIYWWLLVLRKGRLPGKQKACKE